MADPAIHSVDPPSSPPDGLILSPDWIIGPTGTHYGWSIYLVPPRIADLGARAELLVRHPGVPERRLPGRGILAGMVDAHTHLTESFAKSLAFHEPAQLWRRLWFPLEMALSPEAASAATRLACWEALRGGFTTVVDAGCKNPDLTDVMIEAVEAAGVRAVLAVEVADRRPPDAPPEAPPAQTTADAVALIERHLARLAGHARITPSVGLSIGWASEALLGAAVDLARTGRAVIQVHAAQHTREVEQVVDATGLRPIEYLAEVGLLNPSTVVAHGVLTTMAELRLLAATGTGVVYVPLASLWKGNGVARVGTMDALGVRLALGTDATSADGFRTLFAADALQRVVNDLPFDDFAGMPPARWLAIATGGGADVVGLGEVIGRLAPGAEADLLVLRIDQPELTPSWDPPSELVRLASPAMVEEVYVAGECVLRAGQPTGWDGESLLAEVDRLAVETLERAGPLKFAPVARAVSWPSGRRQRRPT